MEDRLYINSLYDFYSELLTDKQRYIFDMYYINDMSLREVAKEIEVTPATVQDTIKKVKQKLITYEDKLNLLKKHNEQKEIINNIYKLIEKLGG